MASRALLILLLLAGSLCSADAEKSDPDQILTRAFFMPASGFIMADINEKDSRIPAPGVVPIRDGSDLSPLDTRKFFEQHGVKFPPGTEALYFETASSLVVRNTRENLDLIEALTSGLGPCGGLSVRSEVIVATMKIPALDLEKRPPSFSQLRELAGTSWKVIASVSGIAKSGEATTAVLSKGIRNPEVHSRESHLGTIELPADDLGTACLFETVIGPDAATMDVSASFRHRDKSGPDQSLVNIRYDGSVTLWDGYPQVLQMSAPDENGVTYAVILRVNLLLPNSWPVQNPSSLDGSKSP